MFGSLEPPSHGQLALSRCGQNRRGHWGSFVLRSVAGISSLLHDGDGQRFPAGRVEPVPCWPARTFSPGFLDWRSGSFGSGARTTHRPRFSVLSDAPIGNFFLGGSVSRRSLNGAKSASCRQTTKLSRLQDRTARPTASESHLLTSWSLLYVAANRVAHCDAYPTDNQKKKTTVLRNRRGAHLPHHTTYYRLAAPPPMSCPSL